MQKPDYTMTVADATGGERFTYTGSVARCYAAMRDTCTCFACEVDSYHRIMRELRATGGAYARYYAGYGGPVLLTVLAEHPPA